MKKNKFILLYINIILLLSPSTLFTKKYDVDPLDNFYKMQLLKKVKKSLACKKKSDKKKKRNLKKSVSSNSNKIIDFDLSVAGFVKFADGIGRQTIGLIDCLKDDFKINFINTRVLEGDIDFNDITPDIKKIIQQRVLNAPSNVTIFEDVVTNSNPNLAARQYYHTYMPKDGIKIAYSMFETNTIPDEWVPIINEYFDAVAVPDKFLIEVYEEAGVTKPIFLLPLGIYIEEFLKKPLKKNQNTIFTFGCSGAFSERKNQLLVLEGFNAAFGNDPQLKLILHGRNKDKIYEELVKKIEEYGLKNVQIIDKSFTKEEYINFMSSLDCYVALSRGEGFSIPTRESLALGIPAIVSNNTAQKTICETGLVRAVKSQIPYPAYYPHLDRVVGYYFDCDLADVKNAFLDIYQNYPQHLKKAPLAREWAQQYTYENLKPLYKTIVKPTEVILGTVNHIGDGTLTTTSKELYTKYKNLTPVNNKQILSSSNSQDPTAVCTIDKVTITLDNLNPTAMQANDHDIIGGYRVFTGQTINGREFLRLQKLKNEGKWDLIDLAHHLLDLDQTQLNLKTPALTAAQKFPIMIHNGSTIFGFQTDLFISHSISLNKYWRPDMENILRKIVKPGDCVIDAGANIGYFTSILQELVTNDGIVLSIDASHECCTLLEESKKINTWQNVNITQAILSNTDTTLAWFLVKNINPGGSCIISNEEAHYKKNLPNAKVFQNKTMRLDDIASQPEYNMHRIDYIKIDCSGSDDKVIEGAQKIIERYKPKITMPFSPAILQARGINPQTFLERFTKLGYKIGLITDLQQKEDPLYTLSHTYYTPEQLINFIKTQNLYKADILLAITEKYYEK